MRPIRWVLTLALFAAGGATAAGNGEPAKVQICAACHGENGHAKMAMYPNLAGQYDSYLKRALHDYRSGARQNAIMNAQAAGLSDAEIDALARWFSSQTPVLYTPSITEPFQPNGAASGGAGS